MKTLFVSLVLVVALYEVNAACYQEWILPPDEEPCKPGSTWDDMDSCVTCYCEYGWMKSCCDISAYPAISDKRRCESFRNENCEWTLKGKKPKWDDHCSRTTSWLG